MYVERSREEPAFRQMLFVLFPVSNDLLIHGRSPNGCRNLCAGSISSRERQLINKKTHECNQIKQRVQKPVGPVGCSTSRCPKQTGNQVPRNMGMTIFNTYTS